ncbi:MAG TPA: 16S rRNA (guanine(527)-N(7))-methyltransferase RsmG [Turneriella sp.]|nr:16S rRNA (guanine(527)-N(7))-methyltransferase RsmG [Turneriella sp.]
MRGIPGVNAASVAQLCRHWAMMVESDDRTDLTRLEHKRDIALKHYLDCALPLKFTTLPSPLLDIGTGAGFPGLVLKILSPQTHVILGEVRPKRTRFLQAVIDELGLKGVEVFAHRIGPQFPLEINGVVTRALESCRDTLYRVQPFLPQGGRVILLKGPRGEEEVAPAIKELSDFAHEATYRYRLANTQNERRLIIFRRERESIRKATQSAGAAPRETEITSRANDVFKSLLALGEARGIRKQERYLVSGEKLVEEILSSPALAANLDSIIRDAGHAPVKTNARQLVLAPALFRELDSLGTRSPLALMRLPQLPTWNAESDRSGVTVFLPFQDPSNIGAAIRSAAALGADRVVLLKEAALPFLPKAIRAAANAVFHTRLMLGPSLAELVRSVPGILRLDMAGADIAEVSLDADVLLLPGVEGYGFAETGQTTPVTIPIAGEVESLNAQSALSIALYEIMRRRSAK